MTEERLTLKKLGILVVAVVLACGALALLYFMVLIGSLPFTGNMTTSWILSLSTCVAIILAFLAYTLKTKKKR